MKKEKIDVIAITLLFLISFFVWTLPFQDNPFPFGEGDGAHQFSKMDFYAGLDASPSKGAYYVYTTWYGGSTEQRDLPLYPPLYFMNGAFAGSLVKDRFLPLNLYIAIASGFLSVLGMYMIIRKSYGLLPGFLAGFALIFPFRILMGFIWGQRAIIAALAYVPVILWCLYKYIESYEQKNEKPFYMYFVGIFAAIAASFHGMALFMSALVLGSYVLLYLIKTKKWPFRIKTVIIGLVIFLIIFLPFGLDLSQGARGKLQPWKIDRIDTLFKWYVPAESHDNPFLYEHKTIYRGFWTIPLLLFSIAFILLRRSKSDLVLLALLLGLYLTFHLDVIQPKFYAMLDRSLKVEEMIFYPLVVLAPFLILQLLKIPTRWKNMIKGAVFIALIVLIVTVQGKPVQEQLKNAYSGILRVTPQQVELSEWLEQNMDQEDVGFLMGPITYPKQRWVHILSRRALVQTINDFPKKGFPAFYEERKDFYGDDLKYLIFDYSDLVLVRNDPRFAGMLQAMLDFEANFEDAELLFDKNNVKVYTI